jgi:hypothetical protein
MKRWIALIVSAILCASVGFAQTPAPMPAEPLPVEAAPPEQETGLQLVTVGAYLNDIQTVTLADHSYSIDLYVWFRWNDPAYDPTRSVEFMNVFNAWDQKTDWAYEAPLPQPDGSLYQVMRQRSLFSNKFPLGAYPFDRQTLVVDLEDTVSGSEALRFVADAQPVAINPEIKLPGYRLEPIQLIVRDKAYPTAFGDLANPQTGAYSQVQIRMPVVRPLESGVFKVLAPILLVIASAVLALLLDPAHVEARIGLGITALLTLVALQFTLLGGLPEVSYLTLLDQIFLTSYAYILIVLGLVVRGSRVDRQGEMQGDGTKVRSGLAGAITLTALYFAVTGGLIAYNIRAAGAASIGS